MKGEIMVFERQLFSLALIEKELHQLYSILSKKVDDLAVKSLFSYISTDSLKHSKILATIFEEVNNSKIREKHCAQNIIHTKKLIKKLVSDIKKCETISVETLKPLVETLVSFENLLLDEYKKAFHLEYTGFDEQGLTKKQDTNLNVFTLIVCDEEQHQKILLTVITLCGKKLSFTKDSLIAKYQYPDSWYVPPRVRAKL
jgi:rubrerythrin